MPVASKLSSRDIALRRLASQRLVGERFTSPVEAVCRLGAVQSQDYAGGKWGIAQRIAGAVDADIERAFADGAIVRTHVLRPTWHFVAAEDIRWMLALTAPRVRATMLTYDRHLGLDDAVFARSAAVITRELSGGRHRTRAQLGEALDREKIDTGVGQRMAHLMMRAELDGLICSGARQGNQSTYALLDERVPPGPPLAREEAMAELAMRYFRTRGPATVHDFSWWSGLKMGDARRAIELAGARLARETSGSTEYWFTDDAPAPDGAGSAHLLPNYDEYFIGFRDRSALQGRVAASKIDVPAGVFLSHVVVVDGELVGGWKRIAVGGTVVVELRLVVDVPRRAMSQLHAQVKRYGEFLGMPVEAEIIQLAPTGKRIDRRRAK
jgi:hypothetical protein